MAFVIAEHEQLANQLAGQIANAQPGSEAIWHLGGSVGAGKHTVLNAVYSHLSQSGLKPIRVSGPTGEHDSAAIAVMQTAVGLKSHGVINGEMEILTDLQRTWDEKVGSLANWIHQARQDVVLLCDEPSWWVDARDERLASETHVTRGLDFVDSLWNKLDCRRVLTGKPPDKTRRPNSQVLPRVKSATALLQSPEHWGALADTAAELATLGDQALCDLTPLSLRLLVCIAALADVQPVSDALSTIGDTSRVVKWLCEVVSSQEAHRRLLLTWARLAIVRGGIDAELYQVLREPELSAVESSIIEHGLLELQEDHYVLPRLLQKGIQPLEILTKNTYCEVNDQLSKYFDQLMQNEGDNSPTHCLHEIERFHHAVLKGDPQHPIQGEPFFPEQLHAAGWALSYVLRDHRSAVAVFQRAIQIDATDDYGHHYLAFNLDWLADDIVQIERHYSRAIALNRTHPWWWSRWICFLITIGRSAEAKKAWIDSCDALNLHEGPSGPGIYESLHLWIARLLLHRGQLDFAEQVLNSTNEVVRAEHVGFRALDRLLTALREAERGRAVFPLSIPPDEWWRSSPHLDFPPQVNGEPLTQWNPARVDGIGNGAVSLVVGKPPTDDTNTPTYGSIELSRDRFNEATLDVAADDLVEGQFLELAFFGAAGILRIRCHDVTAWRDPDLPPFIPPNPRRYLIKEEHAG